MRFKYTFKVHGSIRLTQLFHFSVDTYRFDFITDKGCIREIAISFPITGNELPTVTESPEQRVKMHMTIPSPRLSEVREIMRSIEGQWSLFGVTSIDIKRPKYEWIAETEREKQDIHIFEFSSARADLGDDGIPELTFDLLARPVISAVKEKHHDVILTFYRRGCNDIYNEEYIEAIYDFYFILESAYASGKTKNYAVEREFLASAELRNHIEEVVNDQKLVAMLRPHERKFYVELISNKSVDEVIKLMVNMRGFLHHHTEKRRDVWNPEDQERFKSEAFFLQNLCYKIAFDIFERRAYDDEVVKVYLGLAQEHSHEQQKSNV